MAGKVRKWSEEIKQLANVAQTQPHAAYCAYTNGLSSRWSFLSRAIPDISDLLQPLEEAIQQHLIPALTGRPPCSREERDLLALPVCLRSMGIINPVSSSQRIFEASLRLTSPLVAIIATQDQDQSVDILEVMEIGSVLPLDDHGFSLHKGAFKDPICLRYGWKPPNTPTKCNCGSAFSTNHAMICPMGGFPTIRHNKLHDVTASLLSEVCHNVATEPQLQPLNGESMTHRTVITTDDARLDIRARGFWSAAQDSPECTKQ